VGGCVVRGSSFPISTFCARTRHGQNNPSLTAYARRLRSPCPTSHRPTPARRPDQCLSSFFPPLPMLQPVRFTQIEHKGSMRYPSVYASQTHRSPAPSTVSSLAQYRRAGWHLGSILFGERATMRPLFAEATRGLTGRRGCMRVAGIVWGME